MATKRTGVPSYDKAGEDEPIFVLRAQDVLACLAIEFWADRARNSGVNDAKIAEALECAKAFRLWRETKLPD